jgi:aryl-alcohol dehydrogenase-like predicted oxidoreductase
MQLVLGTAQLGLNYGITNSDGKPKLEQSLEIITYALDNGINMFDTARAYGDSEHIIGLAKKKLLEQDMKNGVKNEMNIITKLSPLDDLDSDTSKENIYKMVDDSLNTSLEKLNTDVLDTLLLHRFYHFHNKTLWNYLLQKRENGKIKKLGVSVYYVGEAIEALKNQDIKHIQLPINILDKQWFCDEFLQLVKSRNDVIIHCRSILLQGILVSSPDKWPKIENVDPIEYVDKLNNLVEKFGFNNRLELCFSYIKSIEWIDGLLVGVDNILQFEQNIKLFGVRRLNTGEINTVRNVFKDISEILLNPSLW